MFRAPDMKMYRRLLAFACLVAGFSLVFTPLTARAQVNDFIIHSFDADYTLSAEDPQGSLHVVENIDLTFRAFNHGILRAIPQRYKGHTLGLNVLSVSSATGAPTQYSTYTQNGHTVLKIGDPNRTVTGEQNYRITYDVSNVISFYGDHDELYWNINGTQWQQTFEKVSVDINVPEGTRLTTEPLCFTGVQGSAESACTVSGEVDPLLKLDKNNVLHFETTRPLSAKENLSVVVGFRKGFFRPSTRWETFQEYTPALLKVIVPVLLFGSYAFMRWRKLGRDAKGRGVIVPQYEPPKGMAPVEMGTLLDFNTNPKDITAMIVDLAIRGYIIIHEETIPRKMRKDKTEYSLELANNDVSMLRDFEQKTLEGLFDGTNFEKGNTVKISALKNKFYTSVGTIQKQVKNAVVSGGYFRSDPARAGGRLWIVVVLLFAACFFAGPLFGPAMIAGLVIALIITAGFALAMPARTAAGTEAMEHAKGLKLYLTMAEADRIKMLQSPDAPYAANHGEPKRTVHLFETLLPYAMIFGVEKEWAKQFESMYQEAPGWYTGNRHAFSAAYLAGSLGGSGFGTAMATSFSSPSSSGSSGFGGGGFSGGGGGGGGGGGW
jgi:uncharacterized membrane protein YgcG